MSWDISLTEKQCVDVEIAEVGNYTYNVSKMYVEAMGTSLNPLHGKKASEIIETLKTGVKNMKEDPEKYKAMNPSNGWGDYEGALMYLETFLAACEENPNATVEVT
jgi:hypothetical protein